MFFYTKSDSQIFTFSKEIVVSTLLLQSQVGDS